MIAFIQNISQKISNFEDIINNYKDAWRAILKIGTSNFDLNQPLSLEILLNANHAVAKTLIYIHSMETFIYGDLKKASINKDL